MPRHSHRIRPIFFVKHYLKRDLAGFYFNSKYPPNPEENGTLYGGYRNNAEEVLFYDFAVQGYDVSFTFAVEKIR